jgi:threonine aldolase
MRQAGIIAAGALYALRNNRERIGEDHIKARRFAEIITESKTRVKSDMSKVETNIVLLDLPEGAEIVDSIIGLSERGVRLSHGSGRSLRAVTHLDVSLEDCEKAAHIVAEYFA